MALIFLASTLASCSEGITRDTLATVLSIEGNASMRSGGNGAPSPLLREDHPGKDSIIETSSPARVALALAPNCLVQLEPDSAIQIQRLAVTKDGNETGSAIRSREVEIRLERGQLLVSHVWGESRARLVVTTSHGQIETPSNAVFGMEANQEMTRVTCATGWIEFTPKNSETAIRIPAGSVGEWPAKEGNGAVGEADARAQEVLQQTLQAEETLRALAQQKRNVLPR